MGMYISRCNNSPFHLVTPPPLYSLYAKLTGCWMQSGIDLPIILLARVNNPISQNISCVCLCVRLSDHTLQLKKGGIKSLGYLKNIEYVSTARYIACVYIYVCVYV